MRINLRLLLMLTFTILLTLTQVSLAQKPAMKKPTPPQPPAERKWYSVAVYRIKPDMITEWQEFQKNEVIPTLKKGGVKQRETWQTATFGEAYEYVFVTEIDNFAQYDGDSPVVKALGQDGARAYLAKARRMISSARTYAVQSRPDLSYEGTMTGPPKLAVVASVSVAAGKNAALENFIKTDVLPTMKQAKVAGYFVSQTVFGGDAQEFVTLTFYDSFADIGKGPPFARVLGPQGYQRFLEKTTGIVTKLERTVVRFVPDLSFSAAGPTATK